MRCLQFYNIAFSGGDEDESGVTPAAAAPRPTPGRQPAPLRRRPSDGADRWRRPAAAAAATYDPFNPAAASAGAFGSRSYFSERAGEAAAAEEDRPRSSSFYFPL